MAVDATRANSDDIAGNTLKPGDVIAYATANRNSAGLNFGLVVGFTPSGKVRVRDIQFSHVRYDTLDGQYRQGARSIREWNCNSTCMLEPGGRMLVIMPGMLPQAAQSSVSKALFDLMSEEDRDGCRRP